MAEYFFTITLVSRDGEYTFHTGSMTPGPASTQHSVLTQLLAELAMERRVEAAAKTYRNEKAAKRAAAAAEAGRMVIFYRLVPNQFPDT